jgi:hypothetical protein
VTNAEPETDKEMRRALDRGKVLVSWGLLRSIGNSRAAKLTILIPLVGYIVLLNDTIISHLELSEKIFGAPTGATLTKLLLIYCGLVCVAVASVIFATRCPLELKKYASSEDYIAGEEDYLSERKMAIIEKRLETGDNIARADQGGYRAMSRAEPTPQTPAEIKDKYARLYRIELNLYYEMLDRSRLWARWTAGTLYAIGIILLLIPAVMVFYKVMTVLIRVI